MATVTFDTLKFANKLKAAGVADKHAEAEAEAIAEVIQLNFKDLVTKEDLRHELKELEMRLDAKLDRLEGKLMGEIGRLENKLVQLEGKLTGEIGRLENKLVQLEGKLIGEISRLEGKLMGETSRLSGELTEVRGEITLMKWMLGVLLTGVVSLVLKAFFV